MKLARINDPHVRRLAAVLPDIDAYDEIADVEDILDAIDQEQHTDQRRARRASRRADREVLRLFPTRARVVSLDEAA